VAGVGTFASSKAGVEAGPLGLLPAPLAAVVGRSYAEDAASQGLGSSGLVTPANHTITVLDNGGFLPSFLSINEGDSVTFAGPSGTALRTTDAIVRVNQADIDAAALNNNACMASTLPYTIDHMLPGDDNELTGPLRRGPSGIYALGPERSDGYFEGPVGDSCETIFAAAGSPLAVGEASSEVMCVGEMGQPVWCVPGAATTKLCVKEVNGKKSDTTNSPYLLQSTWDNPDVTGAVIRINWEDLYTMTLVNATRGSQFRVGSVVETYTKNWSKLDVELENAAKRGKLVILEILAGDGIPRWLFSDHVPLVDATATGLVAKSVVPIKTRDFGSNANTSMPTDRSCGYDKTMGSPADEAYKTALLTMLRDVATRIRGNARHYQALGSLKVTGLNFLTGEIRLPKRCLDPTQPNKDNGNSQSTCFCNTRIWATPLGTRVKAYDDGIYAANPLSSLVPGIAPIVTGGGYTSQIAQNFLNAVENTIYVELGRRKTMHFMLIQDGFPHVLDATHYHMDSGPVWPNVGYVYVDAQGRKKDIPSYRQTVDALNGGQFGNFRKVNADGSPNLAGGLDPDAHALFSPMHAGLGPIPVDTHFEVTSDKAAPILLNACVPALATALVNGKTEGVIVAPEDVGPIDFANYRGSCPNKWAAREGYEGQIIGYQTTNSLAGSDDLSATLWNATLNSNAVFVEVYEKVLWIAEQERRLGKAALSTTGWGFANVPERQKSLAQWTSELHKRRRTIANFTSNADNRHMKDPFPDSYTFTLKKDLASGELESHFFINPAARCASGTLYSGQIDVVGK
jgi:hypothetical protein